MFELRLLAVHRCCRLGFVTSSNGKNSNKEIALVCKFFCFLFHLIFYVRRVATQDRRYQVGHEVMEMMFGAAALQQCAYCLEALVCSPARYNLLPLQVLEGIANE